MSSQIIRGNALNLPLADDSVDLVVTSPPYFGLRSYQDGGEHYDGQIGDEATPAEFVDALIAATREMMRAVKPTGSIWVNLGDKYGGSLANPGTTTGLAGVGKAYKTQSRGSHGTIPGTKAKSLLGIPWRYALRCIDDLGLILRAEVIWSKPNGLPESVTDRVRRSHEQWFHFTLNPRYYSAVDEVREAHQHPGRGMDYVSRKAEGFRGDHAVLGARAADRLAGDNSKAGNPLGKLPGSVWTVPTEPLRVPDHLGVDHFAAFPTEFPRRIITGWSPRGVCVECGAGRRPVSERVTGLSLDGRKRPAIDSAVTWNESDNCDNGWGGDRSFQRGVGATITGEACDCPEPLVEREVTEFDHAAGEVVTRTVEVPDPTWQPTAPTTPGVVLDPFGGTGTTALVADALGRHGISVDMSRDYCRLAEWRTTDPKQRAKAARKPFTPAAEQVDGQASLLELIEEAI